MRERKLSRAFTLDVLGEAVTSEREAEHYLRQYTDLIEGIAPIDGPTHHGIYARLQFAAPTLLDSNKYFLIGGTTYQNTVIDYPYQASDKTDQYDVDLSVGRRLFDYSYATVGYLERLVSRSISRSGGTSGVFATQTAPTSTPAQDGGSIKAVLIAGDVTNSVFSASTEPLDGVYGTDVNLTLPHGHINAKVEGTISNDSTVATNTDEAFFAHALTLAHGPVTPPNVPEAPFPHPKSPPVGARFSKNLQPSTVLPGNTNVEIQTTRDVTERNALLSSNRS